MQSDPLKSLEYIVYLVFAYIFPAFSYVGKVIILFSIPSITTVSNEFVQRGIPFSNFTRCCLWWI